LHRGAQVHHSSAIYTPHRYKSSPQSAQCPYSSPQPRFVGFSRSHARCHVHSGYQGLGDAAHPHTTQQRRQVCIYSVGEHLCSCWRRTSYRHALVAKAEELIRNARVPKELVVVHTPEPTAASASKRHIADQFMRKFIGRCMVKVANDLAGATPQACAAVLKQLKASALDDAEFVSSPSLSHLYLLLESDPISSTAAGSAVLLQLRQQPAAE